jgi:hypothetical protein
VEFDSTPEEEQAAMIQALQKRLGAGGSPAADFGRAYGNLGMQSGDRVLGDFAQAQIGQANQLDQRADQGRKFGLMQLIESQKEARRRKEQLSDMYSQRAWQDQRDKLARQNHLDEAAILAGEKEKVRQSDQNDKQIELLSKRTEGAAALKSDLGTLQKYANEGDVPGVGMTGFLPNLLVSDDGVKVRQAKRGIVGNLIKQRSGTAASEKEIDRILEELGMSDGATDDQFRTGLSRLSQQSAEALQGVEAGARPEAVREARRRGLTTSEDIPQYSPGGGKRAAGPHGATVVQGGVTYQWNPATGNYE